MYKYVVSFGPEKARNSATFFKFTYAQKFFHDLVAAGLHKVRLDTVETDEKGADYIDRS